MRSRYLYLLAAISGLCASVRASDVVIPGGPTYVSGSITTQTWDPMMAPYIVDGAITVPTGNTLTILPGVDVQFDADVQFIVEGALSAVGTETDSIRFIKGTAAEWGGLRFTGGVTSSIAYARISDGNANGSGNGIYGGAIYAQGAGTIVNVSQSVISSNSAAGRGGAIYLGSDAQVSVDRTVLADNSTPTPGGGGAFETHSDVTFTYCTFVGNDAGSMGSVGRSQDTGATATLVGCIAWGNAGGAAFVETLDGVVVATYSDIEGGWAGTGNINADPLFVDAGNDDYSLGAGSPCIDAGDPASPLDVQCHEVVLVESEL